MGDGGGGHGGSPRRPPGHTSPRALLLGARPFFRNTEHTGTPSGQKPPLPSPPFPQGNGGSPQHGHQGDLPAQRA